MNMRRYWVVTKRMGALKNSELYSKTAKENPATFYSWYMLRKPLIIIMINIFATQWATNSAFYFKLILIVFCLPHGRPRNGMNGGKGLLLKLPTSGYFHYLFVIQNVPQNQNSRNFWFFLHFLKNSKFLKTLKNSIS